MGGKGGDAGGSKNVDTTKFYKLLEVEKGASEADIKRAYRRLAVKHHPDKGGDPEKFKEITRAYEVLGDSEKRARYDRYGEEGLQSDPSEPTDIFDAFFGPRSSNGGRKRQKTKDVVQNLQVDLFKGIDSVVGCQYMSREASHLSTGHPGADVHGQH